MSSFQNELRQVLIEPRSVAIIGASDEAGKTAGRPLAFLRQNGFAGEVFAVNPHRKTVQGEKAYPSLASLPSVDHAFIVLPTEAATTAFEDCARHGVKVVSILADGFAEAGDAGKRRQAHLRDIAAQTGCRILGPNSLGIVRMQNGLTLTANAAFSKDKLLPGRLTVLSQSGSLIGTFFSRGKPRGIGFSNLISVGNEADLSIGEIGTALVDDSETDAFILFLETIRQPDRLAEFAERAANAGKPIIAYKLGRSEVGAELAVSHTGAMIGSDAAADCFLRDIGIARVEVFESLLEAPALFLKHRTKQRPTVSIVTTTGGGAAMVADRIGLYGIDIREIPSAVRERLAAAGFPIKSGRIADLTLVGTKYDPMRAVADALLASSEIDVLIFVVGSSAEFFPEQSIRPIADAVKAAGPEAPPVAVFIVPQADRALAILAEAGVAAFRTPEACADSVIAFMRRRGSGQKARPNVPPRAKALLSSGPTLWNEFRALELFTSLGVPATRLCVVSVEDAGAGNLPANSPPFPIVAKLLSADLPHKTEAGAVTLGISNRGELRTAVARMLESAKAYAPRVTIDGIMLQEQRKSVAEAILGYRKDPAVGPVVTIGVGGVFAEIYRDISIRRAPLDAAEVSAMIDEVKGFAILKGYRGAPRGDIAALCDAVVRFSQIAGADNITEAEINPLLIGREGEGVVAVDGLIVAA